MSNEKTENTNAIEVSNPKSLVQRLQSVAVLDNIRKVCSTKFTPERLAKMFCATIIKDPKLLACTYDSLYLSMSTAAQLGLEPNMLGSCYIIAYNNNKKGCVEAQLQIGYRGLIDLARRSGEISMIEAHVIHKEDKWAVRYGSDSKIDHEPNFTIADWGPAIAVYAIATLKDGSQQREVMKKSEVDTIRAMSKDPNSTPWAKHYEEMMKKTVIRRLCKYLPLTTDVVEAIDKDDEGNNDIAINITPKKSKIESGELLEDVAASMKNLNTPSASPDKITEANLAHIRTLIKSIGKNEDEVLQWLIKTRGINKLEDIPFDSFSDVCEGIKISAKNGNLI